MSVVAANLEHLRVLQAALVRHLEDGDDGLVLTGGAVAGDGGQRVQHAARPVERLVHLLVSAQARLPPDKTTCDDISTHRLSSKFALKILTLNL